MNLTICRLNWFPEIKFTTYAFQLTSSATVVDSLECLAFVGVSSFHSVKLRIQTQSLIDVRSI